MADEKVVKVHQLIDQLLQDGVDAEIRIKVHRGGVVKANVEYQAL